MARRKRKGLAGAREEHKEEFHRALRKSLDLVDEAEDDDPCRGGTQKFGEAMRWLGIAQANLFFAPPSESSNAAWGLVKKTQARIMDGLFIAAGSGCPMPPRRYYAPLPAPRGARRTPSEEDAISTGEMAPILRGLAALRSRRR